jgi:hypothetical protein
VRLRCQWLESLVTSLVFKSSNWRMIHLWVKASTSKTCSRSLEWKMQRPLVHLWGENFGEKDSWQTVGVFILGGWKTCFCATLSVRVGILFVGIRESWSWVHDENLYKGHNSLTKLNVNTSSIWLRFAFECVIWPW